MFCFHTQQQNSLMYSTKSEGLFHSHTQDSVNVGNTPQEQGQITYPWSVNDSGMVLFYFRGCLIAFKKIYQQMSEREIMCL